MIALSGVYQDGFVRLDETLVVKRPIKVIVTFLEDIEDREKDQLSFNDFSFSKSRKILEDYKGSLSDSLIEERRSSQ